MSGGDLMPLREILGYSSLRMVMRYAHLADAYKREMMNKLNGKFVICHLTKQWVNLPPKTKPCKILILQGLRWWALLDSNQ